MKHIVAFVAAAALAGCSTLPDTMYSSPEKLRSASNFELCRAALDPDARMSGTKTGGKLVDSQVRSRGLNRESCFDVLLGEHGSSTMCSRYQRAVARGEPTALVGFTTTLTRQDMKRGFARNNLSCAPRAVNTESGWEALGRQVDSFNNNMSEAYRNNKTVDCYEVYEGKIRCRQY